MGFNQNKFSLQFATEEGDINKNSILFLFYLFLFTNLNVCDIMTIN